MRGRLIIGLLALWSNASAGPALAAAPVAVTDAGRVQGVIDNGVKAWRGIPFAAPPVGARRWRPPQPVTAWRGVRDGTHYGHDCMQLPFPADAAPLATEPSEDCLFLNI
jgi:para-nitrobenzyl esterase